MIRLRRSKNEYGGKGPLTFPADHVPAIRVPKGGSSCSNCMFVDAKNHACKEPHYIEWNGSPKLPPLPLDEICSDWYDWPGSAEQHANARRYGRPMVEPEYYIWTLNQRGEPVGQSIAGGYQYMAALTTARDQARKSALDRAVSIGANPTAKGFRLMAVYEARTGRKID